MKVSDHCGVLSQVPNKATKKRLSASTGRVLSRIKTIHTYSVPYFAPERADQEAKLYQAIHESEQEYYNTPRLPEVKVRQACIDYCNTLGIDQKEL